jgi:enoyl-[acyl-carrier protein] reductase III
MRLQGKRALITGSSRGIGRGIALKLAKEGAAIAVHYLANDAAAKATLAAVREAGSDGVLVQGDITDAQQVPEVVRTAAAELGGLDIFVNNARPELPAFFQPPLEITLEAWDAAMNSQGRAFLLGAREAAVHMADGGRILAVTYATGSRTGGLQPWVGMGAAKAAMEATVRYFAVALAPRRITVNALGPAWTEDSVLNTLPIEAQDAIREWHQQGWTPMGRLATPADVGNAAALLCSPEADFITGQNLTVDGGASLMNPEVPPALQLPLG